MDGRFDELRIAIISSDCGGSEVAAKVVHDAVKRKFPTADSSLIFIDDLWPGRMIFGVDWYLSLARKEYYRLIRLLIYLQKCFLGLMKRRFKVGIMRKLFDERKEPHLIISTVPFVIPAIFQVAQQKNIPIFVLSTDMDSELYSFEWPSEEKLPSHRFGVFCDHKEVLSQVNSAVDRSKLVFTGGFVREAFTHTYTLEEKAAFRAELGLPKNREIISIMMGSLGGKQLRDYLQRILEGADNEEFLGEPHFVMFCAKNGSLRRKMERLVQSRGYIKNEKGIFQRPFGGVSFSILGFVDRIHRYFACSAGIITKPGGGSLNETLAQNVPLIIDKVHGQLPWEQLASKVLHAEGAGVVIEDFSILPRMINDYFLDKEEGEVMRAKQQAFHLKYPSPYSFSHVIGLTVEKLLNERQKNSYATTLTERHL